MFNIATVSNEDELGAFYIALLLAFVLFGKHFRHGIAKILIFLAFVGVIVYGMSFIDLGSQVMLLLLIIVLYAFFKKLKIIAVITFFIMLLLVGNLNLNIQNDSALAYKINNIIGLVEHLDKEDVYLIPQSPQVRIIELINLYSYPWYNIIFGHGIGGYFTDDYLSFNKRLGKFDYSETEIETRHFYNPHNLAYNMLKFGIFWELFMLYLFLNIVRLPKSNYKIFLSVGILILALNFGYGIKNSILLSIILIMLKNEKYNKRSFVIEKN